MLLLGFISLPIVPAGTALAEPTCTTVAQCNQQLADLLRSLTSEQQAQLAAAIRSLVATLPFQPIQIPGIGQVGGGGGGLADLAKLITAASYVAGMGFAIGAILKFKAHKDNPTQVPISLPIALVFVAAALIFVPSVFRSIAETLFGQGGLSAA